MGGGVRRERFDDFVERCLYDPEDGFYVSGTGRAGGRSGDFLTSPEVGPLFGEVIARFLDDVWIRLGRPDPFTVLDAGAGPGTLVRQLATIDGPSAAARTVRGFDRAHSPDGSVPGDVASAVVIANELLDNVAFRILEYRRGVWHDVYVVTGNTGDTGEELLPVAGDDDWARTVVDRVEVSGVELVEGLRLPLLQKARHWISEVLAQQPALLVAFDYGELTTAELDQRGGWLRTYRQHQLSGNPLFQPGQWDITTDIAVDQLPPPTETINQAAFLRRWGIDDLVAEGRRYWKAHAAHPNLAAMKMRSRVVEAEALLDPAGLGRWLVCTWDYERNAAGTAPSV